MRIAFLSDTHDRFGAFIDQLPEADVLVHCGDITVDGYMSEYARFAHQLKEVKHKYKKILVTAGNHDEIVQKDPYVCKIILKENGINIHLLLDEPFEFEGVKFFGSPMTPAFGYYYFMYERGEEGKRIWSRIPEDTDILFTHGLPYGIFDAVGYHPVTNRDVHVGCSELKKRIDAIKPRVVAGGHIHLHGGKNAVRSDVLYINACVTSGGTYKPKYKPTLIDFNVETKEVKVIETE